VQIFNLWGGGGGLRQVQTHRLPAEDVGDLPSEAAIFLAAVAATAVAIRLSRIVALYYRASTLYQIH
jgi:hypothetical protein